MIKPDEEEYDLKTVTTRVNKYRVKQADSFKRVDTIAADWEVCEIIDMVAGKIPVYELPPYNEVTPYFDNLVERVGRDAAEAFVQHIAVLGFVLCELCGCPRVKHPCAIQCDSKELFMYVGSECVENFMGSDVKVTKQVKIYKDSRIKQLFIDWVYNGIQQCYLYKNNHESIWIHYKRLQKKLHKTENDIESYSTLKIKNLFKRAYELGLIIPQDSVLEFDYSANSQRQIYLMHAKCGT